jgi:hypothetical protein
MDTPTLLTDAITTSNVAGTTVDTASISPAANKQVFVNINITTYSGTPPAVSITANDLGLAWTEESNTVHDDITTAVHYVFSGVGASPSSGQLSIVIASGNAVASFAYQVVEVGAGGSGSTIVQQSNHTQGPSESPTDTTITGLSALTGSNGVIYFASRAGGTGSPFAAAGGSTLLAQTGASDSGVATFYNTSGTTSPQYTISNDFVRNAGLAFEIGESGGGGGGSGAVTAWLRA